MELAQVPEKTLVIAIDNLPICLNALEFTKEAFPKGFTYHLLHIRTHTLAEARTFPEEQMAEAEKWLNEIFIPKAAENGAKVTATIRDAETDGPRGVGAAICSYVDRPSQHKPTALILMKTSRISMQKFFLGSVTKYCAVHCSTMPVIIVPAPF